MKKFEFKIIIAIEEKDLEHPEFLEIKNGVLSGEIKREMNNSNSRYKRLS